MNHPIIITNIKKFKDVHNGLQTTIEYFRRLFDDCILKVSHLKILPMILYAHNSALLVLFFDSLHDRTVF